MKYIKKTYFLLLIPLLPFSIAHGNLFMTLFNRFTSLSLVRSLSLRYQIFLKTKELNRLEKSYKIALNNALNTIEYISLDNKIHNLFLKNYIIQKELGGLSISHAFFKLFHGPGFMKKHQNDLALYNKLCDEKNKIFIKTYRDIYTKDYYGQRNNLRRTRHLLNEEIPFKGLQKPME